MKIKTILSVFMVLVLMSACKKSNDQLIDEAYNYRVEKKYDKAIEICSEVIKRNDKIQEAYYNRGFCYSHLKKYKLALADFNKVMDLHMIGTFRFELNQDSPFAGEEAKAQVPFNDALYQRAQIYFLTNDLTNSFNDFKRLVGEDYEEKSNCFLWLGTIMLKSGSKEKACDYFQKGKQSALNLDDSTEANKMLLQCSLPAGN